MSNNNPQSKIGKNIKKLRQENGASQDRLSKLADLSLNTVVTVPVPKSAHLIREAIIRPTL